MEALDLSDAAEKFQLPQIREMIEGLLNAAGIFNPKFRPTPEEVDAIAKPAATLLARRPQIQNAVKKFAAPGVLAGAIGAYLVKRMGATSPAAAIAMTAMRQAQPARAMSDSAAAAPPVDPSPQQQPAPAKLDAQQAQAVAAHAQSVIDSIRSGMPA